jgi:hypothetical protein
MFCQTNLKAAAAWSHHFVLHLRDQHTIEGHSRFGFASKAEEASMGVEVEMTIWPCRILNEVPISDDLGIDDLSEDSEDTTALFEFLAT